MQDFVNVVAPLKMACLLTILRAPSPPSPITCRDTVCYTLVYEKTTSVWSLEVYSCRMLVLAVKQRKSAMKRTSKHASGLNRLASGDFESYGRHYGELAFAQTVNAFEANREPIVSPI